MFNKSKTNKRYHTLNHYFKEKYQSKVGKICIDANYTCINRDGIKSKEGCLFCPGKGISGIIQPPSINQQIINQKEIIQRKWGETKYLLFFQNFSNTYASLQININNYKIYKDIEDVIGLSIATRVDSLSDSTLKHLDLISQEIDVTIELGLQTINDQTRKFLNCHYTLEDFLKTYRRISKTNCSIVVHLINGLPGEDENQMLENVKFLNNLNIQGIKIHMLHIDKSTKLAEIYRQQPFELLSLDQYTDIVIKQLQHLNQDIVIHRLTGDPTKDNLIAPLWTLNKTAVLNTIDKKMAQRDIYQGDYV